MSFVQDRVDIETRLNSNWSTTAIAWDNVPYVPAPGTPWVKCQILPSDVNALEFGRDTLKAFTGIIDIGIFTPKSSGSATAREYADTLSALFDMVEFGINQSRIAESGDTRITEAEDTRATEDLVLGRVDCDEASVQNRGIEDDWYQLAVLIPFTRREA